MLKNKIFKTILILLGIIIILVGGMGFYMFNKPHRNVQNTSTDYTLSANDIVAEYLEDSKKANGKYLDAEGESKVLEITGEIFSITSDFNNQKVILLKEKNSKAGVSCTFLPESDESIKKLKVGQTILVKGVIRSGASYDEDLEMYENVILDKCKLINI